MKQDRERFVVDKAQDAVVKKVIDLVREEGKSLEDVWQEVPQARSNVIWRRIHQLLNEWKGIDADISRAAVRAARMQVLSDALESKDGELTLRAADQIASDPEVGLKSAPQTTINIDFGPVEELLNKLGEGDIVDAEFTVQIPENEPPQ